VEIKIIDKQSKKDFLKYDAISLTANDRLFEPTFSTQWQYVDFFEWDSTILKKYSEECNSQDKVLLIPDLIPKVILVPKTKDTDDLQRTKVLMESFFKEINDAKIETLVFTHFSYITRKVPYKQIIEIYKAFLEASDTSTLKEVVWKVDNSYQKQISDLCNEVLKEFFSEMADKYNAEQAKLQEDWNARELQEQINDYKDKQIRFSIRYPKVKFQNTTYVKLSELAEKNNLPKVPPPLILAAWHFSSSLEKQERWKEIIEWANLFGYSKLIPNLTDQDYEYD